MIKSLKALAIIITILGIFLSLAVLKNWTPNPRIDLANKILNLKNNVMPIDTPYANIFLYDFLFSKQPRYNKYLNDLNGIVIEDLLIGSSRIGTVYIEHKSGRRHKICSFKELEDWSKNYLVFSWLGWWLIISGRIVDWLLSSLEHRQNISNKTIKRIENTSD
jgi:hypothetical protein